MKCHFSYFNDCLLHDGHWLKVIVCLSYTVYLPLRYPTQLWPSSSRSFFQNQFRWPTFPAEECNYRIRYDNSWSNVITTAKLTAAPPIQTGAATVSAGVCVVLVNLALCVAQPTRSSPVLTTVSWAAVTDVKSHYPNAAISLTRSRVNEFVEMCDPFLIR